MSFVKAAAHNIASHPWIYDLIQYAAGLTCSTQVLAPHLSAIKSGTVLDAAGGTGLWKSMLPVSATHICLDIDAKKLKSLRTSIASPSTAVRADVLQMCFKDKSFDYSMCIALSHHLSSPQCIGLFSELSRVTKKELIFLDAIRVPRLASRLMWYLDRGVFPHTEEELDELILRNFQILKKKRYDVYHSYLFYVAKPIQRESRESHSL